MQMPAPMQMPMQAPMQVPLQIADPNQGWKNVEEFFNGDLGSKRAQKMIKFLGMLSAV